MIFYSSYQDLYSKATKGFTTYIVCAIVIEEITLIMHDSPSAYTQIN